jgi:hypothetical protein
MARTGRDRAAGTGLLLVFERRQQVVELRRLRARTNPRDIRIFVTHTARAGFGPSRLGLDSAGGFVLSLLGKRPLSLALQLRGS